MQPPHLYLQATGLPASYLSELQPSSDDDEEQLSPEQLVDALIDIMQEEKKRGTGVSNLEDLAGVRCHRTVCDNGRGLLMLANSGGRSFALSVILVAADGIVWQVEEEAQRCLHLPFAGVLLLLLSC